LTSSGDDLIGVHVRLGAGAGLERDERKLAVERPGDNLAGGANDQRSLVFAQFAEREIRLRRRLLDDAKGANDHAAPDKARPADWEVLDGALGLCAPQSLGGHIDLAKAVSFAPYVCHRRAPSSYWVRWERHPGTELPGRANVSLWGGMSG
jgi:hypothetical protein